MDELTQFIKNINNNPKLCEQFSFSSDQIFDFKRTYCYLLTKETYCNLERNYKLAKQIVLDNKKNESSIFEKVINVTSLYNIEKKLWKNRQTSEEEFEEVKKNILDYEEEISVQDSVESYFKHIKGVLKQNLGSRYKADENWSIYKNQIKGKSEYIPDSTELNNIETLDRHYYVSKVNSLKVSELSQTIPT